MSRLSSSLAMTAPLPRPGQLLRKLLDGAQAIAAREVDAFRFRLAEALLKVSETSQVPADEQASFHAHNLLRKQGERFSAAFVAAFSQHSSAALRALEDGREDVPSLMWADLESAEVQLLLDDLAHALDRQAGDALFELNCNLAALLERDGLRSAHNPWRAHVFLISIYQAWCSIDDQRASRRMVLGLLGPKLFLRLEAVYAGLNAVLSESGITADSKAIARARRNGMQARPIRRSDRLAVVSNGPSASSAPAVRLHNERYYRVRDWLLGATPPPSSTGQDEPAHLNLPDLFAEPDARGKLQANTINVAVTPRLSSHLSRLQQKLEKNLRQEQCDAGDLLRHIGRGLPPGTLTPLDEKTLELMERLFEQLLQMAGVADFMQPLLLRLQIPVLKVALKDRKFFLDGSHPAHRLLDQILACAPGWDASRGEVDELRLRLQRAVDRIAAAPDPKPGLFAEASAELKALLQQEQKEAEIAVAACMKQALKAEKYYQAELSARADILERLESGAVPYALENFLQSQWLRVLTLAHAARHRNPELLPRALQLLDDLLWSLQARSDAAERATLLQRLPGILSRLKAWLDAIKWQGPERAQFFETLAQQHAALVRSSRDNVRAHLDTALAQARRASERSMLGARRRSTPGSPPPENPVDSLCHGDWLALRDEDEAQHCMRIAWVSPQRSHFVLASRRGACTRLISELELERRLQAGQARLLKVEGAVDRALDAALDSPEA